MWLAAPQFPPLTDIQNNLGENESSHALVAEAMTLGFLVFPAAAWRDTQLLLAWSAVTAGR